MEIFKKLGIKLQYDPGILLPQGKYSGENHNSKRHMYPNVYCSVIYNSQDMKSTWMSISR